MSDKYTLSFQNMILTKNQHIILFFFKAARDETLDDILVTSPF